VIAIGTARAAAQHFLTLAEQTDVQLGAFKVATGHMEIVEKHAGAQGDIAGIYGVVRVESGVEFEN
jgi:hypothetical protein